MLMAMMMTVSNLSQCECDEINVQGSELRAHAQVCSATQAVRCAVALSSPPSSASVSLSFLPQFYFFHVVVLILLLVIL